jgi:hypothetical protein
LIKKYWDRKPVWLSCYQCGKDLSNRKDRLHFGGGPEYKKGYCWDCWNVYFSNSVINQAGKYRCCYCKKYLSKNNFTKDEERKYGLKSRCKKCDYKQSRKYLRSNPEKLNGYIIKHRDARLKLKRKTSSKERDTLSDDYIRRLLARYSELTESEFPQIMVDLKRSEMLLYRKINNRKVLPIAK